MAMVFIFIKVSLILDFSKLYVVLSVWIEGLCVVPLAPTEITRRGATF
jgi:accessory gene regulator protein AgrB